MEKIVKAIVVIGGTITIGTIISVAVLIATGVN